MNKCPNCGCEWAAKVLSDKVDDAKAADEPRDLIVPCCGYKARSSDYPVFWNPHNGLVQCHNCGETWQPLVRRVSMLDIFEDKVSGIPVLDKEPK